MDTKNILRNEKENENELGKENFAEKLQGFMDAKTGWITIPVTGKMFADSSKLESFAHEFRKN